VIEINNILKCMHDLTVNQGQQHVKNWKSVWCTYRGT